MSFTSSDTFGIQLYKDAVLLWVNDLSDYHISIDNMSIRPVFFGVKLEAFELQDKQQTLLTVPEAFVGFRLPFDGHIVRTIILDSPSVSVDLTLLPEREQTTFHLPILPRLQSRSADIHLF